MKSYYAEIGHFENFGYLPSKVEVVERNGAVQLVSKGRIDYLNRTDGKNDLFETEKWTFRIISLEADIPVEEGFFDYQIPLESIVMNQVTGKTTYPPDFEKKIQTDAALFAKNNISANSSSAVWKKIVLWIIAILVLIISGIQVAKWRKQ